MSNELAKVETKETPIAVGNQGMQLNSLDEVWRFAVICAKSHMAPKSYENSAEKIMVGVQAGMELGFTPMASLKAICVVNQVPSVWGDAMKALVERSPDCEYVKEWIEGDGESMVAVCEAKRKGRPETTVARFSYQDAKNASLLGKDIWKKYTKRMLQMRARSWCLRDQFADLLCGMAAAEEVQDYTHIAPEENKLVSGAETPPASVEGLLEVMDADEGDAETVEQTVEPEPFSSVTELVLDAPTKEDARQVYDEWCGPESTKLESEREEASRAWTERCNREATKEAGELFA